MYKIFKNEDEKVAFMLKGSNLQFLHCQGGGVDFVIIFPGGVSTLFHKKNINSEKARPSPCTIKKWNSPMAGQESFEAVVESLIVILYK